MWNSTCKKTRLARPCQRCCFPESLSWSQSAMMNTFMKNEPELSFQTSRINNWLWCTMHSTVCILNTYLLILEWQSDCAAPLLPSLCELWYVSIKCVLAVSWKDWSFPFWRHTVRVSRSQRKDEAADREHQHSSKVCVAWRNPHTLFYFLFSLQIF